MAVYQRGTGFALTFPSMSASDAANQVSAVPGRVLVVEDEPAIRMFLTDALEDAGYQVMAAANGIQALELLAAEQWRPDVIVLDMLMPAMDGATFAEAYRRSPEPHAPIVVVTAYRTEALRAADAGAVDDVLIKPLDLDRLLTQVDRHVRGSARRAAAHVGAGRLALLLAVGLLGLLALGAASPAIAQSRLAVRAPQEALPVVETSSVAVTAQGELVRISTAGN